tara:strand:- start:496 stop:1743 length:1248 start_codon:yes stop_codon:yes gene_type:complete
MGLTKPRAAQIFDIDYKQATRVITVSNVTLTSGAPAVVDGVSLTAGDRVLVTGQSTGSENGLYAVSVVGIGSDGTWVRTSDGNEDGEIQAGMIVMVTEGTTYHDTQWKLTTDGTIDIGTTTLVFELNTSGNSITNGTSNITVLNNANVNVNVTGSQVAAFASTGTYVTGLVSATGNVVGTYIKGDGSLLTGLPETYANANVAAYLSSGTVSTDINTTAAISATGAITGGSLVGAVTTAAQTNITSVGALTSLSVTGNITGGNISTTGSVGSHLVPSIDLAYSLGNATHRWANLYLSGNTIYLGNSIITESANGDVVIENSGSFAVPVGTTLQRSAIQGAIRYNTTIGGFETFDGAGWNKLAYGTATDFPFGDYGSLTDTITSDAFGISLVTTFDCNDPGPLQSTDLGDGEAYVGA